MKYYFFIFIMFYLGFCMVNENVSVNYKVRCEIKKFKLLYYEIKDNVMILLIYIIYWVLFRKFIWKLIMINNCNWFFVKFVWNNFVYS